MAGIVGIDHPQRSAGDDVQVQNHIDLMAFAPHQQPVQQFPARIVLEQAEMERHADAVEAGLGDLLDIGFRNEMFVDLRAELVGLRRADRLFQTRGDGRLGSEDAFAEDPAFPHQPSSQADAAEFHFASVPIDDLHAALLKQPILVRCGLGVSRRREE